MPAVKHAVPLALVGVGGLLGSIARYAVALQFMPAAAGFPWSTFSVNMAGSFLIGLLGELAVSTTMVSAEARLFLVTGFCGGFTTFSAYMYEYSTLMKDGQLFYSLLYLGGSILGGLIALYTGTLLAKLWS